MDYRQELIKYVRQIIGDVPDVEDIVHDTILSSIEHQSALKDKEKEKQWIFRIARNKSFDFLKNKQRVSNEIPDIQIIENHLDDSKNLLTLAHNHKATYDRLKELYLHKNYTAEEIRTLLIDIDKNTSTIPLEYVEAMLLSEFQDLTQQQIADNLNIPLPTVKSRIQRAKEKAKRVFFKCCDFEFDSRGNIVDYSPVKK